MRIIKPGREVAKEVIFRCSKCGGEFAALKDLEAERIPDQRDGDFWMITCPTEGCNNSCTKQVY